MRATKNHQYDYKVCVHQKASGDVRLTSHVPADTSSNYRPFSFSSTQFIDRSQRQISGNRIQTSKTIDPVIRRVIGSGFTLG